MGMGSKRLVLVDCRAAGISGDMFLGALLDLGLDQEVLSELAKAILKEAPWCRKLVIRAEEVERKGFRAKRVLVEAEEERASEEGLRKALISASEELGLSREARELALRSLITLLEAEAAVHGPGHHGVHELASVDTLVDILGVAKCLEELGLLRDCVFYSTPIAVGSGLVRFSHGDLPVPAPATLEILRSKGFPFLGGLLKGSWPPPPGSPSW